MPESIESFLHELTDHPDQSVKLDRRLASSADPIDEDTRLKMWAVLDRVLEHGPNRDDARSSTGLLLGRIQSGKTTAMTGMSALAHDRGYRIVIAILGSTRLLLTQNTLRFLSGLGISGGLRSDYAWVHLDPTVDGRRLGREVHQALETDRTVLITVLKNSSRLRTLAAQLDSQVDLANARSLILDDEADQASLNTLVAAGVQSPTYASIGELTRALGSYLYVQVTATPFAPLLLDPSDNLSPSFVEFLDPGPGYTGAREFFIDHGDAIIRLINPNEALTRAPATLSIGLTEALSNFLVGSAMLLAHDPSAAPVSMLVHPTHRVAVHERVALLIRRELNGLAESISSIFSVEELPTSLRLQLNDLLRWGAPTVRTHDLLEQLRRAIRLAKVSMVNSAAEQDAINWSASPVHILVGGNKLDRGFTVEGLTVTYLSRTSSQQADTLAQRARAFGYRSEYLPYCRFYTNSSTAEAFRSSVITEEAMRNDLRSWIAEGKDLRDWSERVGFVLGSGLTPTRQPVAPWLTRTPTRGWHILANPDLSETAQANNAQLLVGLGLLGAPTEPYGRLGFRTLHGVAIGEISRLISNWVMPERSGWSRTDIAMFIERVAELQPELSFDVVLLDGIPPGTARTRSWRPSLGFSNIMQGRDNGFTGQSDQYPGDRAMFGDGSGLQVHWLTPIGINAGPLYTLALHLGDDVLAATEVRRA